MFSISATGALFSCALFTLFYVGSLYLWTLTKEDYHRDHPTTVKRRFISVFVTCAFAYLYTYFYWIPNNDISFHHALGVHTDSLLLAAILPLLLTAILFIGPIALLYIDGDIDPVFNPSSLHWWRNFIVGPASEEWVFRSCMCPLLIASGFSTTTTIFVSPFFFGIAHLHHIIQHLHKQGTELQDAWIEVLLQLFYTSVFGCYSAFLFLRTGHFLSPFLAHWFCNYMGFPRFHVLQSHSHKNVLLGFFVLGLVLFFVLLFPMTNPSLYYSMYWQ